MVKCNNCNKFIMSIKEVDIKTTGNLHKTAYCAECGKYIKHLGKEEYRQLCESVDRD